MLDLQHRVWRVSILNNGIETITDFPYGSNWQEDAIVKKSVLGDLTLYVDVENKSLVPEVVKPLLQVCCPSFSCHFSPREVDNIFGLKILGLAASCGDPRFFFNSCEIIYIFSGRRRPLLANGDVVEKYIEKIAETCVYFETPVETIKIPDDVSPSVEAPVLSELSYEYNVQGQLVSMSGGYIEAYEKTNIKNPFNKEVLPVGIRSHALVSRMASSRSVDIDHFRPAPQILNSSTIPNNGMPPLCERLSKTDVFGENGHIYALRQRLVLFFSLAAYGEEMKASAYWDEIQESVMSMRTNFATFAKYSPSYRYLYEAAISMRAHVHLKRKAEKTLISNLMKATTVACPVTGRVTEIIDSSLQSHFAAWAHKRAELLEDGDDPPVDALSHFALWSAKERSKSDAVWPVSQFGLFSPRSYGPMEAHGNFDNAVASLRKNLAFWRKMRANLILPDYIGKFSNAESFEFGKPYSVLMKWAVPIRRLVPEKVKGVDAYGVGSENYFLANFMHFAPFLGISGLNATEPQALVNFFDNNSVSLARFFYAKYGDVLSPRRASVIISDVEIDLCGEAIVKIFASAHDGVAIKILLKNESFVDAIRSFVAMSLKRSWRYAFSRCGCEYNGEFIAFAGPAFSIPSKSKNPTIDDIQYHVQSSVVRGEGDRRRALMLYILGRYPELDYKRPDLCLFFQLYERHRANRNVYVASAASTACVLATVDYNKKNLP